VDGRARDIKRSLSRNSISPAGSSRRHIRYADDLPALKIRDYDLRCPYRLSGAPAGRASLVYRIVGYRPSRVPGEAKSSARYAQVRWLVVTRASPPGVPEDGRLPFPRPGRWTAERCGARHDRCRRRPRWRPSMK
jgi:hypothetical protein